MRELETSKAGANIAYIAASARQEPTRAFCIRQDSRSTTSFSRLWILA